MVMVAPRDDRCDDGRIMSHAFDTLLFADGLKDAGTPVAQAEATARLLGDALAAERSAWPTRADLASSDARRDMLFGALDQRADKVEQRVDKVEQRLERVEQRLDKVEQRLDTLVADVAVLRTRVEALLGDMRWVKGMLGTQFAGMLALVVGVSMLLLQHAAG